MADFFDRMADKGLTLLIEFGYLNTVNQFRFHMDGYRPLFHHEVLAYTGYTYRGFPITGKIWRWN